MRAPTRRHDRKTVPNCSLPPQSHFPILLPTCSALEQRQRFSVHLEMEMDAHASNRKLGAFLFMNPKQSGILTEANEANEERKPLRSLRFLLWDSLRSLCSLAANHLCAT